MYRLDLDLPAGLYSISTMLGGSIDSKTVLLDRSRTVEIESSHRSFGDRAFALASRIRSLLPASCFDADAATVVTLRGPFRKAAAQKHRVSIDVDGTAVAAAVEDLLDDGEGGTWSWQLFRLTPQPRGLEITTATRTVEGTATSHVIPRFGDRTVWAAYPAPADVAVAGTDLPLAYYARLRLTEPGIAPDLGLQCLSDQVFTALANRSALPLSPPVLDLLFAEGADPLLGLAAAHLASLSLAWYGFMEPLPQDETAAAARPASEGEPPAYEREPIPPPDLRARVIQWLERGTANFADRPDVLAVKYLYGLCNEDVALDRPPVLLRSLDALIKAEHEASKRGRRCDLGDSVWRSRFQVSDVFAFLQWETNTKKGEAKRLELLKQSFAASQALQQSLDALRLKQPFAVSQAQQDSEPTSGEGAEASGAAAPAEGVAPQPSAAQAMSEPVPQAAPASMSGGLLQRAEQAAALGRFTAADALAKLTGSSTLRQRATSEFETYLKLNAQALRLPTSAIGSLARQFAKKSSMLKK
ncbi:MAG TPA: hypothetical protein PLE54_05735 [Burkholderiaceae bacterium]|nr:hypothetical protein [Burkholderiaceae bacterium]